MTKFWALVRLNYKTSLAGLAAFLLNVPGLVTAISAWGHHQPINWRELGSALALSVLALGVAQAKANNVHSVLAQVEKSTVENPQIQADSIVELKTKPPEGR